MLKFSGKTSDDGKRIYTCQLAAATVCINKHSHIQEYPTVADPNTILTLTITITLTQEANHG